LVVLPAKLTLGVSNQDQIHRFSDSPWISDLVASRGCFLHGWGGSWWCGHE